MRSSPLIASARLEAFLRLTVFPAAVFGFALALTEPPLGVSADQAIAIGVLLCVFPLAIEYFLIRCAAAVLTVLGVSVVIALGAYEARNGELGQAAVVAIFQVDIREAVSYLSGSGRGFELSAAPFVPLMLVGLPFLIAGRHFGLRQPVKAHWAAKLLRWCTALACLAVISLRVTGDRKVATVLAAADGFQKELEALNRTSSNVQPLEIRTEGTLRPVNVALLITESVTRNHLGIYGYPFDTTPRLERLEKELAVFRDAVSPHSHTAPSLIQVLSAADAAHGRTSQDYGGLSIVSVLRDFGVDTTWLSNQNYLGLWDNPITIVARASHRYSFVRGLVPRPFELDDGDDRVFELFRERALLSAAPSLTVLHTYVSHFPYCGEISIRYRKIEIHPHDALGRSFFGDGPDRSRELLCYDRNIRYLDERAVETMIIAAASKQPWVVIVLADHGEAVTSGLQHESSTPTRNHVEIPLLVFFNQAARTAFPEQSRAATENAPKPFVSSSMFQSVLDLFGVKSVNGLSTEHDSVFSANYRPDRNRDLFYLSATDMTRYPGLNDERSSMRYDDPSAPKLKDSDLRFRDALNVLRERSPTAATRIWAHRVNSLGKLISAAKIFDGFEFDIVFRNGAFTVGHPPDEYTGLSLSTYLEAASRTAPRAAMWLDWKDASLANLSQATEAILLPARKTGTTRRLIVETSCASCAGSPSLELLRSEGIRTSYYVPTDLVVRCGSVQSACAELAVHLDQVVAAGGFDYLSSQIPGTSAREILNSFQLPLLTWDLEAALSPDDTPTWPREPLWEGFDVVLVPFPTSFDR